jgi:hypothetical protein
MGKRLDDSVLDGELNVIKNSATQLCVCSSEPINYTQATATYKLAIKAGLTSGAFTGPTAGDVSGRKLTVNQQAGVTVDSSGDGTHVALCSASVLLAVTTCTLQTLTAGNTVTIPAWKIEIASPT